MGDPIVLREVEGCCGSRGGGRYVILRLSVRADTIVDISFESNGCPSAHQAVGGLAAFLKDRKLEQARRLDPPDLLVLIGGLPDGKGYYADMAVDALRDAIEHLDLPLAASAGSLDSSLTSSQLQEP